MGSQSRHLPTEIYDLILLLLSKKDIKRIRLTSHALNEIASVYLFDTVYWAYSQKCLDNFVSIVRHPVFSKLVTSIVWDDRRPDGWCERETWDFLHRRFHRYKGLPSNSSAWFEQHHSTEMAFELSRYTYSEEVSLLLQTPADEVYAESRLVYEEQKEICYQDQDLKALCEAMTGLPALKRVILSPACSLQGQYIRASCHAPLILPPSFGWQRNAPHDWLINEMPDLEFKREVFERTTYGAVHRGFDVMMRALASVDIATELDIRCAPYRGVHLEWLDLLPSSGLVASPFRHLRSLCIPIDLNATLSYQRQSISSKLFTALSSARKLRDLEILGQPRGRDHLDDTLMLANIIGNLCLGSLTKICLNSIVMTAPLLFKFFRQNAKTLRDVHLNAVRLVKEEGAEGYQRDWINEEDQIVSRRMAVQRWAADWKPLFQDMCDAGLVYDRFLASQLWDASEGLDRRHLVPQFPFSEPGYLRAG